MNIVIIDANSARYADKLLAQSLPPDTTVWSAHTVDEALPLAAELDVVAGWGELRIDPLLAAAPGLKLIQSIGAGVDGMLSPSVQHSAVPIANARGANAPPIAEHVLALMLTFSRRIHVSLANQLERRWDYTASRGTELAGQTVGILGMGSIGQQVAKRAAALGMRVASLRRPGRPEPADVTELLPSVGALASASDFLVIAVPLTPDTKGIVSEQVLAAMKPGSYLMNVSRGQTVDEAALIAALKSGHLAGAGLDVFSQEPLPPESPFWGLPNVVITPHVAGSSPRTLDRALAMVAENLHRLSRGQPLLNLVDKQKGY